MHEPIRLLCEHHVGRKLTQIFGNLPGAQVERVPDDLHRDDNLIIGYANENHQTIVTRDDDFPTRRL